MTIKLTIQRKLFALSFLGLGFVVAVGATGFFAASRLASSAEQIANSGSALKSQLQADQAHDALRSDVLAALLAGEKKDAAEQKAVRGDLEDHAKLFRESLKRLEALPLDDATRQAVGKIKPALIAYLESATTVVGLAFTDRAAAQAKMGDFLVAFKSLEKEMAALSDLIEEQAKQTQVASDSMSAAAKFTIVAAVVLSVGVLLVIGGLVSRSIVGPIKRAVQIAETV
ncbi:MAG: MCP four helix bundle domain-containing protein, partial [Cytophagales bacterium]|nr:MCP four helix bundle domain-containing protein [Rhizobacter sp.]